MTKKICNKFNRVNVWAESFFHRIRYRANFSTLRFSIFFHPQRLIGSYLMNRGRMGKWCRLIIQVANPTRHGEFGRIVFNFALINFDISRLTSPAIAPSSYKFVIYRNYEFAPSLRPSKCMSTRRESKNENELLHIEFYFLWHSLRLNKKSSKASTWIKHSPNV